ncbi:MAG: alpha/beta hydrolase family esterase [Anaerolineales bacterium]|jgi:polyhydroxybutyrate depolymerase
MKRKHLSLRNGISRSLCWALLFVSLWALLAGCSHLQAQGRPVKSEIDFDGRRRTYYLVRPEGIEDMQEVPLVLALHGGGGNARSMCRLKGGIQELANSMGFLVACPQGIDHHWNDGRLVGERQTVREGVDDVGFLLAVIQELESNYPIDSNRIYVTGVSNGGMMTLRMACEASDTFTAAAAVIAELPAELDCSPQAPLSILLMNGTEDPLVPWEGGLVHFLRRPLGRVLSTQATISFWVTAQDCPPDPEIAWLPDVDPEDGTRIRVETYAGCHGGSRVRLVAVEGGGHTWPGGSQYAPRFLLGAVSRDAAASELIWGFFAQGDS